jgi:ornithine cyclodeaminase/alanine dehydrogenase-like protein (mu-crystallin family)
MNPGVLRTMPAYLEGQDLAGVKIVNVHTSLLKMMPGLS